MQGSTHNWRGIALAALAAIVSLFFVLVSTANACPHQHKGQDHVHGASHSHELAQQGHAPSSEQHDHASVVSEGHGGAHMNCVRYRCSGAFNCGTCCVVGELALKRPPDLELQSEKPAQTPLLGSPIPAFVPAVLVFPDRSPQDGTHLSGKSHLVSVSRRLRL